MFENFRLSREFPFGIFWGFISILNDEFKIKKKIFKCSSLDLRIFLGVYLTGIQVHIAFKTH